MAEKKPAAKAPAAKAKSAAKGLWNNYDGAKKKNKTCPKCGGSVLLAEHKDRLACGRCKYTEFKDKKPHSYGNYPSKNLEKKKMPIEDNEIE